MLNELKRITDFVEGKRGKMSDSVIKSVVSRLENRVNSLLESWNFKGDEAKDLNKISEELCLIKKSLDSDSLNS